MSHDLTMRQIFERAARGVGRVDRDGTRGMTGVTMQEIEAMAILLALMGLKPVWPSQPMPDQPLLGATL